jgi:hypothetical protein
VYWSQKSLWEKLRFRLKGICFSFKIIGNQMRLISLWFGGWSDILGREYALLLEG